MNTQQQHDPGRHWRQNFRAAYDKIKFARPYALDESSELSLGAICAAFKEKEPSGDLGELLERLANLIPSILQQRADAEEEIVWPVDEVTGERLPNPWESGGLQAEKVSVFKAFPRLAEYFEKRAKEGPWKLHIERLEKAAERAATNALTYGPAEHETNPFRGTNRFEQTKFVQANSEAKVRMWENEAKPVTLPWQNPVNRTELGRILKSDPELGQLATAAIEIQNGWAREQEQIALAEVEAAKQKLIDAEAALGKGAASEDSRLQLVEASAQRPGLGVPGRKYEKAWRQ